MSGSNNSLVKLEEALAQVERRQAVLFLTTRDSVGNRGFHEVVIDDTDDIRRFLGKKKQALDSLSSDPSGDDGGDGVSPPSRRQYLLSVLL